VLVQVVNAETEIEGTEYLPDVSNEAFMSKYFEE
jgi:hypothetical protein